MSPSFIWDMFRHMRPPRHPENREAELLASIRDDLTAILHHLHRQETTMSALSDSVAIMQADITAVGTAITDLAARVAAGGTTDPDVAAAVAALQQAHTDLTNDAAALAAIAPAQAPAA